MALQTITNIDVDFCNNKYILINAKQYDKNSRFLLVTCYNKGEIYSINSGEHSAYIRYKKSDGNGVFNLCEINRHGKVLVELTEQMLISEGICYADLVIVNKGSANVDSETGEIITIDNASILSTMTFCIDVHESSVENSQIESSYEYDGLNIALEKVEAEYKEVIQLSKSYAIGNANGIRENENYDNAKYYYEQSLISANNAKSSENASYASEKNARTYMNNAESYMNNASASEQNAETYMNNAKTYMNSAKNSETNAKTSETNAKTSEQNAKTSETNAKTSETNSKNSETNAKTSETNAKTSEQNAKTSETNASKSEQNAKTYMNNASASEQNAETYMNNAKTSETNALKSEANAKASETNAKTSETNASKSQVDAKTSEINAKTSETNALTSEQNAKTSETNALDSANFAKSYAVGGTGTRNTEDTDNAQYYYQLTKNIVIGIDSGFIPMGTISFSELSEVEKATGYVYNISDNFVTNNTFREGDGKPYTAGTNVYYTADGYWDCFGGATSPTATVNEVKEYLGI